MNIAICSMDDLEYQLSIYRRYNLYGQLTEEIRQVQVEIDKRLNTEEPVDWVEEGF